MFTDTHCHLTEFGFRLPEIVSHAIAQNVTQMIVPAASSNDWANVLALQAHPETKTIALGVHPWFAHDWNDDVSGSLQTYLSQNKAIWVGEIGLDFLHTSARERQQQVFRQQVCLAQQFARPIIIHNVRASSAILQIIREENFQHGGIIHAFSGSLEEANLFVRHGFLIGIGVLLLNPNAKKIQRIAHNLPLENIVLETDSPFMLPENTPSNIIPIAQTLAHLRGISLDDVAQQCEKNLQRLFTETLRE